MTLRQPPPGREPPSGLPPPAVGAGRKGSSDVTRTLRRILYVLPLPLALGAVPVVAAAVLALVRRVRTAVVSFLRTALGETRSVHTRPSRALALWGRCPRVSGAAGGGADPGGAGAGAVGADRAHGGGVSRGGRRGRAGAHAGRARFGGGRPDRGTGRGGRGGRGGHRGGAGVPGRPGVAAVAARRADAGRAGATEGDPTRVAAGRLPATAWYELPCRIRQDERSCRPLVGRFGTAHPPGPHSPGHPRMRAGDET